MRARGLLIAATLIAGCAENGGTNVALEACGGQPGLHVVVDLSASACQGISPSGADWAATSILDGTTLDKTNAVHVTQTFDPRRLDYLWRWPGGVTDGLETQVTWYGSGDGATEGTADARYQVDVTACVEVQLTPVCHFGFDAGVDAP